MKKKIDAKWQPTVKNVSSQKIRITSSCKTHQLTRADKISSMVLLQKHLSIISNLQVHRQINMRR